MTELDATEIMCAEIKTPMNFKKTAEFAARIKPLIRYIMSKKYMSENNKTENKK
jgi:hypothetical protein